MEPVCVPVPVDTRAPGGRTNAYLVGAHQTVLLDPADRTDALTHELADRDLDHVVVTHTHPDHVGGVEHYAKIHGATLWARRGRERRFERAVGVKPDQTFSEGSRIGPMTVIETPGHAPDHVAFALGEDAFVGDLAVAKASVFVGDDDGDVRTYLVSLRRMLHRDFNHLYPGHGPPITDPRVVLTRLLSHKLDRERQVLDAVRAGATTTSAIVEAAYDRDLTGLADLAGLAVEAHLEKLAVENKLKWDGNRATPR